MGLDRLTFLGRPVPYLFEHQVVVVAPGRERAFHEAEWRDALVVVERGAIELRCVDGTRRRFGPGGVLWLTGLPIHALHNPGSTPAVLSAVSRRRRRHGRSVIAAR